MPTCCKWVRHWLRQALHSVFCSFCQQTHRHTHTWHNKTWPGQTHADTRHSAHRQFTFSSVCDVVCFHIKIGISCRLLSLQWFDVRVYVCVYLQWMKSKMAQVIHKQFFFSAAKTIYFSWFCCTQYRRCQLFHSLLFFLFLFLLLDNFLVLFLWPHDLWWCVWGY